MCSGYFLCFGWSSVRINCVWGFGGWGGGGGGHAFVWRVISFTPGCVVSVKWGCGGSWLCCEGRVGVGWVLVVL